MKCLCTAERSDRDPEVGDQIRVGAGMLHTRLRACRMCGMVYLGHHELKHAIDSYKPGLPKVTPTALEMNVARILEDVVEGREFEAPHPYLNLSSAILSARDMYEECLRSGETERAGRLRPWIEQAIELERSLSA